MINSSKSEAKKVTLHNSKSDLVKPKRYQYFAQFLLSGRKHRLVFIVITRRPHAEIFRQHRPIKSRQTPEEKGADAHLFGEAVFICAEKRPLHPLFSSGPRAPHALSIWCASSNLSRRVALPAYRR